MAARHEAQKEDFYRKTGKDGEIELRINNIASDRFYVLV